MEFLLVILAFTGFVAGFPALHPRQTYTGADVNLDLVYSCGGAPYIPSKYTCYNNNKLCPVINDRRTLPCGDACYDTSMYGCYNNVLQQIHGGLYSNGTNAQTSAVPGSVYPTGLYVTGFSYAPTGYPYVYPTAHSAEITPGTGTYYPPATPTPTPYSLI